jgi:membrane-associated phospholipid phosphatase
VKLRRDYRRILLRAAAIAMALVLVSIVVLDGLLAVALSSLPNDYERAIDRGVAVCEVLFAFPISPYLYGTLILIAGLVSLARRPQTLIPWALLFVGSSHVTARFVVDILKPPLSRLRPFEAMAADGWQDTWFAEVGNSFPSGHAVHFWSLFFPLAVLFPRWKVPLLVLPVLVSAARVAVNDHYLSDVLASAAVAALVTFVYAIAVLDIGLKRLSNNIVLQPTAASAIMSRRA